jgi:proteasome lid subunit RPN8/RPN11
MARPKILGETKREPSEREPPEATTLQPHDWLSDESMILYKGVARAGSSFALYLSSLAEERIRNHAVEHAPRRLEVMGFLLGEVNSWRGRHYSVVRDVVTTELKSSSAKVRFDPDAFPKLFASLDDKRFDYILVGWYHSHPGHTCFLSRTDLETQRTMFDQAYHSALVIDPVNEEVKAFRLDGDGYAEVPFAVFPHHSFELARRPGQRTRRLKVTPYPPG